MNTAAPIGVFDSGLGGLSVLRELEALLPAERFLYAADSAHVPYGGKGAEFILGRSFELAGFLVDQGAKALVIACNTATAAAAPALRERWPEVPILGMEPAVKPAVAASVRKIIGVLATTGTVASARFAGLLDRFGHEVTIVTRAAPGLPECVERGDLDGPEVQEIIAQAVGPMRDAGADVIVLGCTHYPFLRQAIQAAVGPEVTLIDTGAAVARHLQRRLRVTGREAGRHPPLSGPRVRFWTSGETATASEAIFRLRGVREAVGRLERV
jgi:glutamate racemase